MTTITAPLIKMMLPGICGNTPTRAPYVIHIKQPKPSNAHAVGETPDMRGFRTMRTICGTTMAMPSAAPR